MDVIEQEARPAHRRRARRDRPGLHDRDRRRDQPAGPPLARTSTSGPGVSVRLSIANYETLVANATRAGAAQRRARGRAARQRPRGAASRAPPGKVEFETVDDGREEQVLDRIVKAACSRRSGPGAGRRSSPSSSTRSTTGWSCTPAPTSRPRSTPSCSPTCPASRRARRPRGRRDPGRGRVGARVRPRGPAPRQAAQQGRGRRPRHLPRPRLSRRPGAAPV